MNTFYLKHIISILGITTGIFAFGNIRANASEGQNVYKDTSTYSGINISQNATDLQAQILPPTQEQYPTPIPDPSPDPVPQIETPAPISPGRETRGGSSYIGVGGNIGLGGDTTLSEGSFSVISKIGLTNNFSVRPSALIGDNAVFLIPLTLDFPVESVTDTGVQQISVAPYIGGGAAISTGQDNTVGFLLTGGVDVPLSPQFTANAGVNVGFINDTEVGLMLGVGYNF